MRYQISALQAKQVMETCNPLGLLDSNKRLVVYNNPVECYERLLNTMHKEFPRGWIDIPLLMRKTQGLTIANARELCGRKMFAIIEWDCEDSKDKADKRFEKLKGVCYRMLKVTGCDFSEDALRKALYEWDKALAEQKFYDRDYKEETTNIKFI